MTDELKHIDDIAYFVAFCIETYKNAQGLTGSETSRLFCKTGLTEFLEQNFESIHTKSPQWILAEIDEYLSTYKPKQ